MLLIFALISILIFPLNKVEVSGAWVRTGAEGLNSALYFKIENNSDKPDTLYEVTSSAAKHIQIHETYKKGNLMGMREVANVIINPHSSLEFKPGSYHVMLMNLTKDIKKGEEINFILHFKPAVQVNVKAKAED
jgi:copper(I)-binding protein